MLNADALQQVFRSVDAGLVVEWAGKDGDDIKQGARFGIVRGRAASVLVAERIALNFLQHMSGVASATRAMVRQVQVGSRPSARTAQ